MDTKQEIEEIKGNIEELKNTIKKLETLVMELSVRFSSHIHNGNDGTEMIQSVKSIGNTGDVVEIGEGLIAQSELVSSNNLQSSLLFSVGKDKTLKYNTNTVKDIDTSNLQLSLVKNRETEAYVASVFGGASFPLYTNSNKSITSGGNTLSDSTWGWKTNELSGAYIIVYDSSSVPLEVRKISSNTNNQITIYGTWSTTNSSCRYNTFNPITLGDSIFRFQKLSVSGEGLDSSDSKRLAMDMGYFGSGIGIYFGTGTPEGSVSALVGSIYLRTDSSTTLYVKQSGTSNTGWVSK